MPSFAPARLSAVLARRTSVCASFFTTGILTMGKMIELTASDGHKLSAYRAEPAGKPRGAIVVVQEIFGVNSHVRSVADGYARDGYLAVAPALYDRVQRNYETGYSQDEIQAGMAVRGKITNDQALADVQAAIEYAKQAGKVGIVGYCW